MAGKTAAAVANVGILFTQESGNPSDALALFKKHEVDISHIESRGSTKCPGCHDFIVLCDPNCNGYTKAVKQLKDMVKSMEMLQDGEDDDVPWFPKHISDLDRFANQVLNCGEELEADHPGFTDQEYRKRRKYYADLAIKYRHGEPIPRVEYTEDEIKTWTYIYNQLVSLYPTNACKEFNEAFPLLQEKCGYSPDNIPQLQDISEFLRDQTGFILRPVAGLLSSRDFLAGLAFRVFHATQYIRHGSKPLYTPEPDICHELLGHVPMFADPGFAQFSQEIGLASLGAPEEDIKKLATLYWFTIEFGLCREGNNIKAYGAGLLSSFGEIQYCLTDEPEKREFDPIQAADQEYPITRYQPIYYVADSFESAKEKMKVYAATIPRSFNIQYNPFTHSVEVINTAKGVTDLVKRLHGEATLLESTLSKLRSFR